MTLRETISSLLANSGEGSDPSAALAEAGFGDVDAGSFGTALVHFSDTSTMAEADALAPITTRASTVPFEETDLPESDIDPSGDAFALFQAVDPDPSAYADLDDDPTDHAPGTDLGDLPDGFDSDVEPRSFEPVPETETGDDADADQPAEPTTQDDGDFGGGDAAEPIEANDAPSDALTDALATEPATAAVDEPYDDGFEAAFGDDALDAPIDEGADLFSVDFSDGDDPESDPLDLDFD